MHRYPGARAVKLPCPRGVLGAIQVHLDELRNTERRVGKRQ